MSEKKKVEKSRDGHPRFRAMFRVTGCNPSKVAYSVKGGENEHGIPQYKTEMRNAVLLQANGMKDDIFGPATPNASLNMTIANTELADALLAAFKEHFLDTHGEYPDGSSGMLLEADFRVVGPAPYDTYP